MKTTAKKTMNKEELEHVSGGDRSILGNIETRGRAPLIENSPVSSKLRLELGPLAIGPFGEIDHRTDGSPKYGPLF